MKVRIKIVLVSFFAVIFWLIAHTDQSQTWAGVASREKAGRSSFSSVSYIK